jgi:hypothetical protein
MVGSRARKSSRAATHLPHRQALGGAQCVPPWGGEPGSLHRPWLFSTSSPDQIEREGQAESSGRGASVHQEDLPAHAEFKL